MTTMTPQEREQARAAVVQTGERQGLDTEAINGVLRVLSLPSVPDKIDTDKLPLTQQLVLEVLAARWRLGERTWTFSTQARRALDALEELGLVRFKSGSVERSLLVWLTESGKRSSLSLDYVAPKIERHDPHCTLCY